MRGATFVKAGGTTTVEDVLTCMNYKSTRVYALETAEQKDYMIWS